jgi:hypothetical protein
VPFSTIPIWAQFRNIPFYLLSKELARDLGKKIGSFICIDNDSRGDICDKIIRARARVDINQPLLRWTPLLDEITNEVVIVSICYERLPKFCLACGIIGHGVDACSLPAPERKNMYSEDLGVPPTHVKDVRRWFLPETTGKPQRPRTPALQWRVHAAPARMAAAENGRQQASVDHVAEKVGSLSVHETLPEKKNEVGATSPSASVAPTQLPPGEKAMVAAADITTLPRKKREPRWKRKVRGTKEAQSELANTLTTYAPRMGARRARSADEYIELAPPSKKTIFKVPTLEECLGKDTLRQLRNEEGKTRPLDSARDYANNVFTHVRRTKENVGLEFLVESSDENNVIGPIGRGVQPAREADKHGQEAHSRLRKKHP